MPAVQDSKAGKGVVRQSDREVHQAFKELAIPTGARARNGGAIMTCPNCHEDGMMVLECHLCGKEKCDECAMALEVIDQCCKDCRAKNVDTSEP